MLPLLDLTSEASYRVPLSLINDKKSNYLVAAYIACLRYSTRFNEITGSIGEYIRMFGAKVDLHTGNTADKMKQALVGLCEKNILGGGVINMRKTTWNQGIFLPFEKNYGWKPLTLDMHVLFTVKEIAQACRVAKRNQWQGADNLIEVLNTLAYMRSHMNVASDTISPRVRFNQASAIIDFNTCVRHCGLTEKKLNTHLERIRKTSLGVPQRLLISKPDSNKDQTDVIILANRSKDSTNVLSKVRSALKDFYQGYQIKVVD